jgi:hypothetical protein
MCGAEDFLTMWCGAEDTKYFGREKNLIDGQTGLAFLPTCLKKMLA